MGYTAKNYRENADKTVISGELAIVGDGKITKDGAEVSLGGVKQATAQADSTATDVTGLVTDFNALLAKLRTAGIIANS
ncbi:MAG: head fiber protein [Sporolactobacillus sp.]